jgi:hypothetical protein
MVASDHATNAGQHTTPICLQKHGARRFWNEG